MTTYTEEEDLDPVCAHGVHLISRPGRSNWCERCFREKRYG